MEAALLLSFLDKPHLFSLKQNRFILISLVTLTCTLHVSALTEAILTSSGMSIKKP